MSKNNSALGILRMLVNSCDWLFLSVMALSFTLFSFSTATAQDTLQLATRHNLPPYVYDDAEYGIEVDLIKEIAKNAGIKVEFVQMPRVRMIQSFDKQQIDGILTQHPKASQVGCSTNWYLAHQNFAFTLANKDIIINGLDNLSDKRVVSFDGATRYLGAAFKKAVDNNPSYTEAIDQSTHISLLYKERFDAIVGDEWIIKLAQRRHFERTGVYMKMIQHEILPRSLYVARFHDQRICDAFNISLKQLRENGVYHEVVSNYQNRISFAKAGLRR